MKRAACKILVKLKLGVNFINLLHAHFCTKLWRQKLQSYVLGLKFFGAKKYKQKKCAQNVDEIYY